MLALRGLLERDDADHVCQDVDDGHVALPVEPGLNRAFTAASNEYNFPAG